MLTNIVRFFVLIMLSFTIGGCQMLLQESDQFLKDPKVNVSMTVKDKPPRVVKPDTRSDAVGIDKIMPPEAALDRSLIPQPAEKIDSRHRLAPGHIDADRLIHNEANTADTVLTGRTITEDLVFNGTVLIKGSLVVAPQATLWVEAGSKILFAPASGADEKSQLLVMGRLVVMGKMDSPVLFSSVFDEPAAGDWAGIVLLDSTKNNLLEFLEITGAQTGITAQHSRLTAVNLQLEQCIVGIDLRDSTATIDNIVVKNCDTYADGTEKDLILPKDVHNGSGLGMMD